MLHPPRSLRPLARLAPLLSAAALSAIAAPAAAAAPVTSLVSADAAGAPGDAPSGDSGRRQAAISADGRFVAFTSEAANLVPGDTNDTWDVFVRDRRDGTVSRVSVSSSGAQADGSSSDPVLSADGRFVAFSSRARNLAPGGGEEGEIYLYDRRSGRTVRVSNRNADARGRRVASYLPAISADGRFVAHPSARRIGSGGNSDTETLGIFLYDRVSGRTSRVAGSGATDFDAPALSASGRFVAFASESRLVSADRNRRQDAYVLDRRTGRLALASRGANRMVFGVALSANGRRAGFVSDSTGLAGARGRASKVFVRDLRAGRTLLAGVGEDGRRVRGDATSVSLSRNGRTVAFQVVRRNGPIGDVNGPFGDVFVRDLARGVTTLASVEPDGRPSRRSGFPALSEDGRAVAFTSGVALTADDTNGVMDVFVRTPLR